MKKYKSEIKHLDSRLVRRIRIYTLIAIIMLIFVSFEVFIGNVDAILVISGILIGLLIGIVATRIYRLSWDEETSTVIANMDWIGAAILIFYLIFIFTRAKYLGYWVQGTTLLTIILTLTAGTMMGRVLGTKHDIKKILKAWNIKIE
jgi:hypothetical protein